MKIGIAAIGKLSEDTGGKNYIVHFLRTIVGLHSQHRFVLFVSEGEAEKLGIEESRFLRIVEVKHSSRTPLHKVFAEQFTLAVAIVREKIDLMYYPGNFVSLFSDVPAVVNIRSMAHAYAHYGVNGVRRLIRTVLMAPSARKAKAIIVPSEDIKRDVTRFTHAKSSKITVIPHGVDLALFDGEQNRAEEKGNAVLERYGLHSGNYLLYVSALWRYKRQDQLLRAHAMVVKEGYPNLKLVLAGKGTGTDPKYLEEIHALPRSLGTESLVVFTGGLPQSDLRYLYAHARAFVFPSSYESFGNPIFETWASGVPIAVSNVHSFPEIAGDAALFFDPNNIEEIKEKISSLLMNESLRADLIEKGRVRAQTFTWESTVKRTLLLLETVYSNVTRIRL
ncbi:MAG TPA: glycosyltransferase family 1 protein [Candidatus Kapabacteria bacterium]|jgi:glycosyltransferase involved in cell wall biosynthesis